MTRRGLFRWLLPAPQLAVVGTLRQRRDVFTSPLAAYPLSAAPSGVAMIYLNGMLMLEGMDYGIVKQTLTFAQAQPAAQQPGVVIQVHYWSLT